MLKKKKRLGHATFEHKLGKEMKRWLNVAQNETYVELMKNPCL